MRVVSSPYMHWAKTRSGAAYNLASSGLRGLTPAEFPFTLDDLSLNGSSFYGYPPLRDAVAAHAGVKPDQVFLSLGTSMANFVAMAALIEPGDEVIIEEPVYDLISCAAGFLEAKIQWLPRPESLAYQPDLDHLRRILSTQTRLVVLTNLHNPSSALLEPELLQDIGRLARAVGASVLVDEVYLDSAFGTDTRPANRFGREFVTTNSLTKVYGLSGLRCGWVIGEPEVIEKMWRLSDLFYGIPAHPAERLSVLAFSRLPELLERSRTILARNVELVNEFLANRGELECPRARHGVTIFPKLTGVTVDRFCEHLRHHYETTVVPGHFFGQVDHFRLSFGVDEAVLVEGLRRIGLALDDLKR